MGTATDLAAPEKVLGEVSLIAVRLNRFGDRRQQQQQENQHLSLQTKRMDSKSKKPSVFFQSNFFDSELIEAVSPLGSTATYISFYSYVIISKVTPS